jgi:ABC-type multidrug transport system fused ATPase/permease subunit
VPISALVSMTTVAQTLRMYAGRVYGILDMETTVADPPDAVELSDMRGEMALEDVSLRYQEGGPFAVRDVSLAIPEGSSVCIVGPTGCGKSTVLALLGRLYDPTEGVVRLDGVDVRRLRVRRVRRAVGTILRDCDVFAGTFGDNLRFGAPQATQEEVEAAARKAGLHDFIASQADGYDTRIGNQGLTLSDEQRVRLAVARALITHPPVVTVDDAFCAVDEDVEALLWTAIRDGEAPRTLVVATSRLAMCERADRVVVMQKGSVVQMGTHTELLATPGVYRRMYMRQMGMDALE